MSELLSKQQILDLLDSYIFSSAYVFKEEVFELGKKAPYNIRLTINIFPDNIKELDDTL